MSDEMMPSWRQSDASPAFAARAASFARIMGALGNRHRLLILSLLAANLEMKVSELLNEIPLSQSALSQHLARLRKDGLVTFRREAQTLYYSLVFPLNDAFPLMTILDRIGGIRSSAAEQRSVNRQTSRPMRSHHVRRSM